MEKTRIRELMVKKISAAANEEELLELDALLKRYPEYQQVNELMYMLKTDIQATPDEQEIQLQLDELWQKTQVPARAEPLPVLVTRTGIMSFKRWIAAAAVLIALLAAGMLVYQGKSKKAQESMAAVYKTWKVPYGQTMQISLPDGSTVKMNSGTTLSYPVHFAANQREVKLQGEAFFEVTKNPKRPFLVHAGNLTVRVLGTAFNVKAYEEDTKVETTLIRGKIQVVMDNAPDEQIILSPNEKLTVSKRLVNIKTAHLPAGLNYQLRTIAAKATEDIEEIAWLDRKVAFTNESFGEVAKVIERKYNVKVVFQQEQLKNELITGVFETEDLSRALYLLHMITDFNYDIKGETIILSTNKTK
jgi:transmembrane sensor